MKDEDRDFFITLAQKHGWSSSLTSRYGMFTRESHMVTVAWDPVPPGLNIAYRASRDEPEPDYAQRPETVYGWITEPLVSREAELRERLGRLEARLKPRRTRPPIWVLGDPSPTFETERLSAFEEPAPPPAPPAAPAARSVARFRELEF